MTDPDADVDTAAGSSTQVNDQSLPSQRRRLLWVLGIMTVAVLILDQVSKALAVAYLEPRIDAGEGPVQVIGTLVQFTFTRNPGAAFSLGTGYTWIFSIIALAVAAVILRTARRLDSLGWAIALGGLLGGALGNLIDRLVRAPGPGRGHVVDFIMIPRDFPIFNVADMCVVGSAILMVLLSMRGIEYDGTRIGRGSHLPTDTDGASTDGPTDDHRPVDDGRLAAQPIDRPTTAGADADG